MCDADCITIRIEQIRLTQVYEVRPERTFMQAAEKYLAENQHKRTIRKDAEQIAKLKPYIGDMALDKVTLFSLKPYIEIRQPARRKEPHHVAGSAAHFKSSQ